MDDVLSESYAPGLALSSGPEVLFAEICLRRSRKSGDIHLWHLLERHLFQLTDRRRSGDGRACEHWMSSWYRRAEAAILNGHQQSVVWIMSPN
jgi:hypothetical protein